MKRWCGLILVVFCVVAAQGVNNFFGIPILAEPKDDVNAILLNLAKGELEKAKGHHAHLKTTAPKFAPMVKLPELTLPCADCLVEKDPKCEACKGRLKRFDPIALRYMQYKFESALEGGDEIGAAWKKARKGFEIRKKRVPERVVFQARIIRILQDAFLMRDEDGAVFRLMGCKTEGGVLTEMMVGYCWPMPDHPYTYEDVKGKKQTVPSYTINIWWDY